MIPLPHMWQEVRVAEREALSTTPPDEPAPDVIRAIGVLAPLAPKVTNKRAVGRCTFALIVGKWYAVSTTGEVILVRPIELADSRGEGECHHCEGDCRSYCRSCRRGVCPYCWATHRQDHANRNPLVTKTRQAGVP